MWAYRRYLLSAEIYPDEAGLVDPLENEGLLSPGDVIKAEKGFTRRQLVQDEDGEIVSGYLFFDEKMPRSVPAWQVRIIEPKP